MRGSGTRGARPGRWWGAGLVVVLGLGFPGSGPAAAQPLPQEGDRLRIRTTDRWVVRGEYTGQTAEGVTLHTRDDGAVVIPWSLVDHTDRSLGRIRDVPRTFTLTAGASALLGFAALGAVAAWCDSCGVAEGIVALSPIVVAVPLGILAGALWKPERWETVDLRPSGPSELRMHALASGGWEVGWTLRH